MTVSPHAVVVMPAVIESQSIVLSNSKRHDIYCKAQTIFSLVAFSCDYVSYTNLTCIDIYLQYWKYKPHTVVEYGVCVRARARARVCVCVLRME